MRMPHSGMAALVVAWAIAAAPASAQQRAPRFEVAAQTSVLRLSNFGTNTPFGIAGRVSFDVNRWLAIEGEIDYFPSDKIAGTETMTSVGGLRVANDRRRTDALFGVKVMRRAEQFGLFLKARPGVTRLSDTGTECIGPGCGVSLMLFAPVEYRTEFAFDVGGGAEFYPGHRLVARAEIGDTIIRHRSTALPCPFEACTSHNLSTKMALGFRF